MVDRFLDFFIHDAGWFLISGYLLMSFVWYWVCFKGGAKSWSESIKKSRETWPFFMRGTQSPMYLKITTSIGMAMYTFGVVAVLIGIIE